MNSIRFSGLGGVMGGAAPPPTFDGQREAMLKLHLFPKLAALGIDTDDIEIKLPHMSTVHLVVPEAGDVAPLEAALGTLSDAESKETDSRRNVYRNGPLFIFNHSVIHVLYDGQMIQ